MTQRDQLGKIFFADPVRRRDFSQCRPVACRWAEPHAAWSRQDSPVWIAANPSQAGPAKLSGEALGVPAPEGLPNQAELRAGREPNPEAEHAAAVPVGASRAF